MSAIRGAGELLQALAHLSRLECLKSKRGVGAGLSGNEDSVEPLMLEERILVVVDPGTALTDAVSFQEYSTHDVCPGRFVLAQETFSARRSQAATSSARGAAYATCDAISACSLRISRRPGLQPAPTHISSMPLPHSTQTNNADAETT
jgi:hypothetical protein